MRSIRHIALSTIFTLSVFGAVLYTSCSKTACKGVTCINGGTCSGGMCSCPTGIGGNNCETVYREIYKGSYTGFATYYNQSVLHDTVLVDSTYVIRTDTGNTLTFSVGIDSVYTQMHMAWNRPGQTGGNTTIRLSNSTATGSSFSVAAFTIDSFSCTGTGSINANTVSLNLVATPPKSPAIAITLSNFSRQ